MKIKVGWVLVVSLLVSTFLAPTAFAVRRKENEVASSGSVADDDDDDHDHDDDDEPEPGCRGSLCNMVQFPCQHGCFCVPIGMLPIGVCAGLCCTGPSPPPSPTPLSPPPMTPSPPKPPSPSPSPSPTPAQSPLPTPRAAPKTIASSQAPISSSDGT